MLVHPWDAPNNDDEWRAVLHEFDFGQIIAPGGPDRDLPVVVPTHFIFDGEHTIELHLARPNPLWRALAERPRALLSVIADDIYIPAAVNADDGEDPALGVPTSYYAAVQAEVDVEIVDDPAAKAAILARQLMHFEPVDSTRVTPSIDVESELRQTGDSWAAPEHHWRPRQVQVRWQQDPGAPCRDRRCTPDPPRPTGCRSSALAAQPAPI